MPKISGKNLYVSFGGTNLSDTIRNFEDALEQESADATAGADDYRNFVATVKTISVTGEVVMKDWSGGGSALRTLLAIGAEGTLLWGVEGTSTGKPKKGFYARVKSASEAIPFDDVVTLSIEWELASTALLFAGTGTSTW